MLAGALVLAEPELAAEDGVPDCDAVLLPDDPHPAAAAAAAASPAAARPRRALTESVIIPIPFVLAGRLGANLKLFSQVFLSHPATQLLNVSLHPRNIY